MMAIFMVKISLVQLGKIPSAILFQEVDHTPEQNHWSRRFPRLIGAGPETHRSTFTPKRNQVAAMRNLFIVITLTLVRRHSLPKRPRQPQLRLNYYRPLTGKERSKWVHQHLGPEVLPLDFSARWTRQQLAKEYGLTGKLLPSVRHAMYWRFDSNAMEQPGAIWNEDPRYFRTGGRSRDG